MGDIKESKGGSGTGRTSEECGSMAEGGSLFSARVTYSCCILLALHVV